MTQRLPSSIEAEQAILGAILVYEDAIRITMEAGLDSADFYLDANRRIYQTMTALAEQSKVVDRTLLLDRLNDQSVLSRVGGEEYIWLLLDTATTPANLKHYIGLVQDKARMRLLHETASKIAVDSVDGQNEIDEVLDEAERRILDITRSRRTSEFRDSKDVISEVMARIELMSENKTGITGMKTGYKDLDNLTAGFQRGDLIILAARPSMGKSALALNFGMQMAHLNQLPVAVFSLEMPAEQLMMRMLSAKSRIGGSKLRTGFLEGTDHLALTEAANDMRQTPIYFDDTPGIKVAEIFAKCRKLQAEQGLCAIIIDYIQLITGSHRSENRQQEVSEISRSLKSLARELKVPVIALSQLSRAVDSRTDKRPILSDLRESGAIEQDADIVMFLYREEYYNRYSDDGLGEKPVEDDNGSENVELNIAKHRNGATKMIEFSFRRSISAFYGTEK
jgi:replicative DNA helicase